MASIGDVSKVLPASSVQQIIEEELGVSPDVEKLKARVEFYENNQIVVDGMHREIVQNRKLMEQRKKEVKTEEELKAFSERFDSEILSLKKKERDCEATLEKIRNVVAALKEQITSLSKKP